MHLSDGRLASCGKDVIRIYDLKNDYHCDIKIKARTDAINSLIQLENGKLVSSTYQTIIVWTISQSSFTKEHEIENAHEAEFLS